MEKCHFDIPDCKGSSNINLTAEPTVAVMPVPDGNNGVAQSDIDHCGVTDKMKFQHTITEFSSNAVTVTAIGDIFHPLLFHITSLSPSCRGPPSPSDFFVNKNLMEAHKMVKRRSLYALNKENADAIVYLDADQKMILLTREDFSSEEEFRRWKEWSDADFHVEEKSDHVYANHNWSLNINGCVASHAPSQEEMLVQQEERLERESLYATLMEGLDVCLTEAQRRRLWLHYAEGKSLREISRSENVSMQSVSESIAKSSQKIHKFFRENTLTKPHFSGDK